MKGIITKYNTHFSDGIIKGYDGIEYWFYRSHSVEKTDKHLRKGTIVQFDITDEGKENLIATNVKRIGYGTNHPFANDCIEVIKLLEKYVPDSDDQKKYSIRDLQTMINYFTLKEELLPNGREEFR